VDWIAPFTGPYCINRFSFGILTVLHCSMVQGFGAVPSGTRKKTRTISINTNASTSIK